MFLILNDALNFIRIPGSGSTVTSKAQHGL